MSRQRLCDPYQRRKRAVRGSGVMLWRAGHGHRKQRRKGAVLRQRLGHAQQLLKSAVVLRGDAWDAGGVRAGAAAGGRLGSRKPCGSSASRPGS